MLLPQPQANVQIADTVWYLDKSQRVGGFRTKGMVFRSSAWRLTHCIEQKSFLSYCIQKNAFWLKSSARFKQCQLTLSLPMGSGWAVYMFLFPSYPGCRSPKICILKCLTMVSTTSLHTKWIKRYCQKVMSNQTTHASSLLFVFFLLLSDLTGWHDGAASPAWFRCHSGRHRSWGSAPGSDWPAGESASPPCPSRAGVVAGKRR